VSLLDPVVSDPFQGKGVDPPPPVEVDSEEEYQVLSIEDSWMHRNQLQYLIRWTGYDSLRWEPVTFLDGLQAVGEFHLLYPRKPGLLRVFLGEPRTQEGDTVTVQVTSDGSSGT